MSNNNSNTWTWVLLLIVLFMMLRANSLHKPGSEKVTDYTHYSNTDIYFENVPELYPGVLYTMVFVNLNTNMTYHLVIAEININKSIYLYQSLNPFYMTIQIPDSYSGTIFIDLYCEDTLIYSQKSTIIFPTINEATELFTSFLLLIFILFLFTILLRPSIPSFEKKQKIIHTCPHCSTLISKNDQYCEECGYNLQEK